MRKQAIILFISLLTGCASLPLPDLSNIPPYTFVGLAEDASSLEDCRRKAIVSAAEQVALNVSTEIEVKYRKEARGTPSSIDTSVEDSYRHLSEIILSDVVSNTEKAGFKKHWGSYDCYIVVRYPREKIEELRKEAKSISEIRRRIRIEEEEKFISELKEQRDYYRKRDRELERKVESLREAVEQDSWIDKEALKESLKEKAGRVKSLAEEGYWKLRDFWERIKSRG